MSKVSKSDLDILSKMLANNELRPHIDKEFTLKNTKEALIHFMTGKTIGKTIIRILDV